MRATFPAGTVSGSPKVRAMQIINELVERSKRGCYAGAVGYFCFGGDMDSCITLRSVGPEKRAAPTSRPARAWWPTPHPPAEYEETVNKAMGMMRAVELARTIGAHA